MGNGSVCKGSGFVRHLTAVGASFLGLLALLPASAAAGETFYVSPIGAEFGECTEIEPCREVTKAVGKANDGDSVSLAPGEYPLPIAGLAIDDQIDFGGDVGQSTILVPSSSASSVQVTPGSGASLHDIRIDGEGGLQLESGSANRVFVAYEGVDTDACQLGKGTTLLNSVCWTQETGDEDEGVSDALDISSGGEGQDEPVYVRNVTAVAENASGSGIRAFAASSAKLTVDAANVIARADHATDVVATVAEKSGLPEAHLHIVNSDFGEFDENPSAATVTALGTNGNISAPPTFIDPSNGDFHVDGASPTLDGGIPDFLVMPYDVAGNDRSQPGCFGATAVPDMGAFERTPTAACPPPPPLPPPPIEPRKPVFRILRLKLNKKTGAGRLRVEVPGAGTVSLTGSGVKLVRRTAPTGGGVVSLPIQTWAITKVRLAKLGRTRVRLRVIFEGKGGGLRRWGRTVVLRRAVRAKKKHRSHKRR